METPFVFGKIATEKNFTDREQETAYLVDNFTSLINTIIISPRRWGKSSLVNKAAERAMEREHNLRVCHIDLFNVRSEEHFYSLLAQKVISATSGRWEEAISDARKFFSRLVPKISIASDPMSEVTIDFDWEQVKRTPDEVLDLAEKIAVAKGLKIVICIDEFQNIADFTDSDYFQKKLRSHWQLHQHVAYCLYGSKRHMMLEVFTDSSKPFYKFGNLIFLNKIATPYLVDFFKTRFTDTGKSITDEASHLIAELTDNHPYYAQQLAQLSWLRTKDICTVDIVQESHSALVEQLSLLFVTITETLTVQQLNYLNALLAGETNISSTEVMHRYRISSPTSIARSKVALVRNDILDNQGGKYSFQDPIYAYWLRTQYFGVS
ncbi:AAA family ATPase [Bacteroides caecigallinarum]|uniref:AAA family ATPase n=1 Tax=Bacteroides caecigallinarum TaxID=1411144 RepID=UPI001F2AACA3|nr:ATP-binding protein [Bacteroides caecigallinarum]MCF2550696.1 ATP-binding protein [Bacteroides caecigallinarum]